jgi:hypothetical protein
MISREGRIAFDSKLPIRRMSFSELEAKGDRLVFKIVSEYLKLGYFVIANYGHSEGIDVLVICSKDGTVKAVCECKNYAKCTKEGRPEYVSPERFHEELDKLNQFDALPHVEKRYIVSYEQILTYEQREVLKQNNIKLRVIGYEA